MSRPMRDYGKNYGTFNTFSFSTILSRDFEEVFKKYHKILALANALIDLERSSHQHLSSHLSGSMPTPELRARAVEVHATDERVMEKIKTVIPEVLETINSLIKHIQPKNPGEKDSLQRLSEQVSALQEKYAEPSSSLSTLRQ
jgi:hypothetical protein